MTVRRFAEGTEVSAAKSRMEIEQTLTKYGATSFSYGSQGTWAMIAFEVNVSNNAGDVGWRRVRFDLPLPSLTDDEIKFKPKVKNRYNREARTEIQRQLALDQEVRRRWRALALAIKAKLECVSTGITTFEDEFLAHIVLPDGTRFGSWARPELQRVYQQKEMPRGLLQIAARSGAGDAVDAEFREEKT